MTAVPSEVFRRWIMVAVLTERPELGDEGAYAVADRLLSGEVGELAAKVAAVEALHRPWHWGADRKAVLGQLAPEGSESATFCTCTASRWSAPFLYTECPTRRALDGATT